MDHISFYTADALSTEKAVTVKQVIRKRLMKKKMWTIDLLSH